MRLELEVALEPGSAESGRPHHGILEHGGELTLPDRVRLTFVVTPVDVERSVRCNVLYVARNIHFREANEQ